MIALNALLQAGVTASQRSGENEQQDRLLEAQACGQHRRNNAKRARTGGIAVADVERQATDPEPDDRAFRRVKLPRRDGGCAAAGRE